MRKRLLFLAKVFIFSILLFILWRAFFSKAYGIVLRQIVTFIHRSFFSEKKTFMITGRAFYLIPYISLVLATARVRLRKKLYFILLGLAFFFAFDLIAILTGATVIMETTPPSSNPGLGVLLIHALYYVLLFVSPLLLWFLATRGNLRDLQGPQGVIASRIIKHTCPICGRQRAGIVEHIRAAHGKASLKSWRVRRFLVKNSNLKASMGLDNRT